MNTEKLVKVAEDFWNDERLTKERCQRLYDTLKSHRLKEDVPLWKKLDKTSDLYTSFFKREDYRWLFNQQENNGANITTVNLMLSLRLEDKNMDFALLRMLGNTAAKERSGQITEEQGKARSAYYIEGKYPSGVKHLIDDEDRRR